MLSEYTRASAVVILLSGLTLRTHRTSGHPVLREVRGCVEARATLLSLVAVKLTRRRTILAPLYSVSFEPSVICYICMIQLTLHFSGRPLTWYPLSWQIAMAAFS